MSNVGFPDYSVAGRLTEITKDGTGGINWTATENCWAFVSFGNTVSTYAVVNVNGVKVADSHVYSGQEYMVPVCFPLKAGDIVTSRSDSATAKIYFAAYKMR